MGKHKLFEKCNLYPEKLPKDSEIARDSALFLGHFQLGLKYIVTCRLHTKSSFPKRDKRQI